MMAISMMTIMMEYKCNNRENYRFVEGSEMCCLLEILN